MLTLGSLFFKRRGRTNPARSAGQLQVRMSMYLAHAKPDVMYASISRRFLTDEPRHFAGCKLQATTPLEREPWHLQNAKNGLLVRLCSRVCPARNCAKRALERGLQKFIAKGMSLGALHFEGVQAATPAITSTQTEES